MSNLPTFIDAILDRARALESVNVFDGFGLTGSPGDYLMVAVDDPNNLDTARGAAADQAWRYVGHQTVTETGDVTCCALSWNGSSDQKAARDAAFDTMHRLEADIKTDPTVGGACQWCSIGHVDYINTVNDRGAEALVVFTIHYEARI